MKVNVLLSTYNGGKYLEEFIKSLINQTYKNFVLYVRDDGSTDNSLEILETYIKIWPNKIVLIKDFDKNLGPCLSFLRLLSLVEGDYFMFADQDDIWLPEKIEITLKKMKKMEDSLGKKTPILVHTDLVVVDENLKQISASFWKYQGLNPKVKTFNRLIIQNNITGCTMMINKALKKIIYTQPKNAIIHDWWIAIIASAFGIIDFIPKSTVLYRQHNAQCIGAKNYSLISLTKRFFLDKNKLYHTFSLIFKQAEEFYELYKNSLSPNITEYLVNFLRLQEIKLFERIQTICKYRFFKQGFLRNLGYLYFITKEIKNAGYKRFNRSI